MTDLRRSSDQWRALETLPRATVARVCAHFELGVLDRRSTKSHVDALSNARIAWGDVLSQLLRAELKQLCIELHLDASGKEKAVIAARLVDCQNESIRTATPASRTDFVSVPYEISPALQERIRKKYSDLRETVDETHHDYVFARIHRVVVRLEKKESQWQRDLARLANALLHVYCHVSTEPATRRALLAALYYLCSPDDVIPDYQPAIGYTDDAMVLDLCAREVCRSSDTLQLVLSFMAKRP